MFLMKFVRDKVTNQQPAGTCQQGDYDSQH